jgi:hypothetical protein
VHQAIDRTRAYERLDLGRVLRCEGFLEHLPRPGDGSGRDDSRDRPGTPELAQIKGLATLTCAQATGRPATASRVVELHY